MAIEFEGMCPLFQVYDMPTACAFYERLLGFETVAASLQVETVEGKFPHWVRLRRGSVELMLNTAYDSNERPPRRVPARQRWHGDTCLYLGGRDLDAAYSQLIAAGVKAAPPGTTPYGMRQLYFRDPDGYHLCLQQPVGN